MIFIFLSFFLQAAKDTHIKNAKIKNMLFFIALLLKYLHRRFNTLEFYDYYILMSTFSLKDKYHFNEKNLKSEKYCFEK